MFDNAFNVKKNAHISKALKGNLVMGHAISVLGSTKAREIIDLRFKEYL